MEQLFTGRDVWVLGKKRRIVSVDGEVVECHPPTHPKMKERHHVLSVKLTREECDFPFSVQVKRNHASEDYQPKPCLPTDARAGSKEKIAILRARLIAGEELWHSEDHSIGFTKGVFGFAGFGDVVAHVRPSEAAFAEGRDRHVCPRCGARPDPAIAVQSRSGKWYHPICLKKIKDRRKKRRLKAQREARGE